MEKKKEQKIKIAKKKKSDLQKKPAHKKGSIQDSVSKKEENRIIWAYGRYIDVPAQKVRLIADMIRGMDTDSALGILNYTRKGGVKHVLKVLRSAIANAENNFETGKERLYINTIFIDDAPIMKRWKAGSRGRYEKILRRNCHISIGLREK